MESKRASRSSLAPGRSACQAVMKRRSFLQLTGFASVTATLGYGFKIEPELLSVTRREIVFPLLPPELDGLRLAVFGDVHFRPDTDSNLVARLVEAANAESPDLIAIVGDYVQHDGSVIPPLLDLLQNLQARHGIYAVMGNHDGWNAQGTHVSQLFQKRGIDFLINQHSVVRIGQSRLAIAGTDTVWDGRPDPAAAFLGIHKDTPTLALVHEPDYFDTVVSTRDNILQLSGHTHGGQCRVPLLGYAPRTVSWGRKYLYGTFSRSNSRLFVTRGVGTTGIRVRFACQPELAMLTLRTPPPDSHA